MTTDGTTRPTGSRQYPMHPILAGPGLTLEEFEALFPGSIDRRRRFDDFERRVRAFGHFFVYRDALPEDIR